MPVCNMFAKVNSGQLNILIGYFSYVNYKRKQQSIPGNIKPYGVLYNRDIFYKAKQIACYWRVDEIKRIRICAKPRKEIIAQWEKVIYSYNYSGGKAYNSIRRCLMGTVKAQKGYD